MRNIKFIMSFIILFFIIIALIICSLFIKVGIFFDSISKKLVNYGNWLIERAEGK
jgi:uncharacterized ion transporter superfamily protein YfcC